MANEFKIRFNTDYPASSPYKWRVIEPNNAWHERLCHEVVIFAPTWTTTDKLPDGRVKHHITIVCNNVVFEKEDIMGSSATQPVFVDGKKTKTITGYKRITLTS